MLDDVGRGQRAAIRAGCSTTSRRFGDQMRDAAGSSAATWSSASVHRSATAVAVLGMGGSAVVRRPRARRSSATGCACRSSSVRDYELPAWVGQQTLVVAISHSGATEETISALGAALERRCPVAVDHHRRPDRRRGRARRAAAAGLPQRDAAARVAGLHAGAARPACSSAPGMLDLTTTEVERGDRGRRRVVVQACAPDVADRRQHGQAARLVAARPPARHRGQPASWPRWRGAGRRSSTRTPTRPPSAEELPEATHNTVVGYDQPDDAARPPVLRLPGERRRSPAQRLPRDAVDGAAGRGRHRPPGRVTIEGDGPSRAGVRRDRAGRLRELLPGAAVRRRPDAGRRRSSLIKRSSWSETRTPRTDRLTGCSSIRHRD